MAYSRQKLDLDQFKSKIEKVSIDPGSSFFSGSGTSLFTPASEVTIGRVANPFVPEWVPTGEYWYKELANMAKDLALDIASAITSHVGEFAASYVGEKMAGLLMVSPNDIAKMVTGYTLKYTKSPAEILQSLMKPAEEYMAGQEPQIMQTAVTNINKKINEGTSYISKGVSDILGKAPEWATGMLSYISQGPKWVIGQAQKLDDMCCNEIEKLVAEQAQKLENEKQKMINNAAEAAAKRTAERNNKKLEEEIKKQLDEVEQKKALAKSKAKAAVKKALLDVKAFLGL